MKGTAKSRKGWREIGTRSNQKERTAYAWIGNGAIRLTEDLIQKENVSDKAKIKAMAPIFIQQHAKAVRRFCESSQFQVPCLTPVFCYTASTKSSNQSIPNEIWHLLELRKDYYFQRTFCVTRYLVRSPILIYWQQIDELIGDVVGFRLLFGAILCFTVTNDALTCTNQCTKVKFSTKLALSV